MVRDRGATLRLRGGGGLTKYWGEGGKIYFFLLTLYNFKNIGGRDVCPPCIPPPYSVVPDGKPQMLQKMFSGHVSENFTMRQKLCQDISQSGIGYAIQYDEMGTSQS